MICIVDYGVGNLFSLKSSFDHIGVKTLVSSKKEDILSCEKIVLPGVGAFRDARDNLKKLGLFDILKSAALEDKKPFLGICLGMQMLFDKSYEGGTWDGLGLIDGQIVPFLGVLPKEYKIPHIGWNELKICTKKSQILENIDSGEYVYFVHSYYAKCDKDFIVATAEYNIDVPAIVQRDNVIGCQFHPEKSSKVGLEILKNFAKM